MLNFKKTLAGYSTSPLVKFLTVLRVSPNALSWSGLIFSLITAALIATAHLLAGGIMVLVSGGFDMLDGALARRTNRTTRFGGILDSTLDRISEAMLLLGILVLLLTTENPDLFWPLNREYAIFLLASVMLSTPMVSYLRAKAEAAGIDCQLGIFTRPERVIVIALGLLFNQIVIALAIIALLSLVTSGQRFILIWRKTRNEPPLTT